MARTFKEDDTMIANMFFGVVQLESRLVRDPERSGWAMFENRSVWLGDDGSRRATEWEPGVRFGPTPDFVAIEA